MHPIEEGSNCRAGIPLCLYDPRSWTFPRTKMKCFLGLYGARESRRLGRLGPFYADADSGTRPKRRRICAPCRSQKTWFAHTQCGFHAVYQNNFRQIFCRSCCAIEIRCWARKCQKSESSSPKIFSFFFSPFFFCPSWTELGFPQKGGETRAETAWLLEDRIRRGRAEQRYEENARVPSARRRRVGGRRAGAWTRDLVSLQVILGSLATRKAGQPLAHKRCAGA